MFSFSQKPKFKRILELARNVYKTYIPPNINLIYKELLDVIHEQNTKRGLSIIKEEAGIFGLLFLVDSATLSRCTLLNIMG